MKSSSTLYNPQLIIILRHQTHKALHAGIVVLHDSDDFLMFFFFCIWINGMSLLFNYYGGLTKLLHDIKRFH